MGIFLTQKIDKIPRKFSFFCPKKPSFDYRVFWIIFVPGPLVMVLVTDSPLVEIVHDDRLAYTGKYLISHAITNRNYLCFEKIS